MSMSCRSRTLAGYFGSSFFGPLLASRSEARRTSAQRLCEHEPAQPTRQQPAPARWGEHAKYSQTFPCSSSSAAARPPGPPPRDRPRQRPAGAGRGGDAAGSRRRRAGGVPEPRRGVYGSGHAPPRRVRARRCRGRRASVTAAPQPRRQSEDDGRLRQDLPTPRACAGRAPVQK